MAQIPEGARVRVHHLRRCFFYGKEVYLPMQLIRAHILEPESKGGATLAEVEIDGVIFTGEAFCGPGDNYNRRIGRDIAVGRASTSS